MEIPTMLLKRVLLDVGLQLVDTIDRDYREICSRFENEGWSFLTITLPHLDDALVKGLARGRLTHADWMGFRPFKKRGRLPALLQGFFRRIFSDDGSILPEPDVCAIFAIRQVTRLFKKVEKPCSKPRIKAAYERYVSNDREVDWRRHRVPLDVRLWSSVCGYLWADLESVSGELYCFPGDFGPGATAERYLPNQRRSVRSWPIRSEGSFPAAYHAVSREDSESLGAIEFHPPEAELPVRVVQVPKTLKTPRTISVEPSYMMLLQQSIAKPLMVYLESKRFDFESIRFTDQSVNRRLARLGSLDGSLSTIDLKDASDMVDLDLVRNIFKGPCPAFLQLIEDCRSTKAKLPDGTHLPLRKFASMGSALCFPIEAMVFFTIIMYALVKSSGKVPSRRLLVQLSKDVAVYGDDIIVPSSMAPVVMDTLEDFGLKVNHDKSFHTGLFRESCGGDYYNGVDVTPAYVRHWDDTGTLSDPSHKVTCVSLSNTFYTKGLWHASQYLRDEFELRFGKLPLTRHPIGCLAWTSFIRSTNLEYDKGVHAYRVKGIRTKARIQDDCADTISSYLSLGFQPRFRSKWLSEYARYCNSVSDHVSVSRWRQFQSKELGHDRIPTSSNEDGGSTVPIFEIVVERTRGLEHGGREEPGNRIALYNGVRFDESGYPLPCSRLLHLTTAASTTLDTSVRPHVLSLKRGWTATQAGLTW